MASHSSLRQLPAQTMAAQTPTTSRYRSDSAYRLLNRYRVGPNTLYPTRFIRPRTRKLSREWIDTTEQGRYCTNNQPIRAAPTCRTIAHSRYVRWLQTES